MAASPRIQLFRRSPADEYRNGCPPTRRRRAASVPYPQGIDLDTCDLETVAQIRELERQLYDVQPVPLRRAWSVTRVEQFVKAMQKLGVSGLFTYHTFWTAAICQRSDAWVAEVLTPTRKSKNMPILERAYYTARILAAAHLIPELKEELERYMGPLE